MSSVPNWSCAAPCCLDRLPPHTPGMRCDREEERAAGETRPLVRRHLSEEKSDAAEYRVRIGAGRIAIDHLLPRRLQNELGRREHRDADVMELRLSGADRHVQIGTGEAARLRV